MYSIYSIYSIYGAMGCDMSRERGDTMQISSRFTIAVHIFACIEAFEDQYVRAQTGFGAAGAAAH